MLKLLSSLTIWGAITTAVLAAPWDTAQAQDRSDWLSQMTDEERALFRNEVRNYLLENPEIIREAIGVLEERQRQAERLKDVDLIAQNIEQLENDGFSYVGGNPNGDVTVIEFADYRCGFCKRAHPEILTLLERDPNVRLVVKEFPILGPNSVAAARLALAAHEVDPDNFPELNDALMTVKGELTEARAYRIAGKVGYDVAELKQIAAEPRISARLAANFNLADKLGLNGTPSFVIGQEIIRGFVPFDAMAASVEKARKTLN